MEETITNWMKKLVAQADRRVSFFTEVKNRMRREGMVFITWTGGVDEPYKVCNVDTGAFLEVVPPSIDAFEAVWEEHPEWVTEDDVWGMAYSRYPDPDVPEEFRFLLRDSYEAEDLREYLNRGRTTDVNTIEITVP